MMIVIADMDNVQSQYRIKRIPNGKMNQIKNCIYNFLIELDPMTYDYVDEFEIKGMGARKEGLSGRS